MKDVLIAEARGAFKATNASASLIARLADALEAATRVPVQGEPSRITGAKVSTGGPGSCQVTFDVGGMSEEHVLGCGHKRLLQLPRASVPDAATEELDKVTLDRLQELAEQRGYSKGFDAGWEQNGKTTSMLETKLRDARAERDAALAAVERCRGVIASWRSVQASNREYFESGNPGMIVPIDFVGGLSAALDGAPEPGWEVQYGRRNRETGALHWLTGDPRDDWWHENQDRYEHVKRYTSPPLPVEGEKP